MKTIKNHTFIKIIVSLLLTTTSIYAAAPLSQQELNNELLIAARRGLPSEEIERLVDQKADINTPGEHGRTPLLQAAQGNHHETVNTLLELRADPNNRYKQKSALMMAIQKKNNSMIKGLLEHKADVNASIARNKTALVYAIASQNQAFVSELLACDAHLTSEDFFHEPPIYYALRTRAPRETIELLLTKVLGDDEAAIASDRLFSDQQAIAGIEKIPGETRDVNWVQINNTLAMNHGNDCCPKSYATAMSIFSCIKNEKPVNSRFLPHYLTQNFEHVMHSINQIAHHHSIEQRGTGLLEMMTLAKKYTSPEGLRLPYCALLCSDSEQLYTTNQHPQHLAWGIPDYSDTKTNNQSLLKMIDDVRETGYGCVPIFCFIKLQLPEGHLLPNSPLRHCVLIILIKEKDKEPLQIYYDSNNQPLKEQPEAQRLMYFISRNFAHRLVDKNPKKRKPESAQELPADDEQVASKKAHAME